MAKKGKKAGLKSVEIEELCRQKVIKAKEEIFALKQLLENNRKETLLYEKQASDYKDKCLEIEAKVKEAEETTKEISSDLCRQYKTKEMQYLMSNLELENKRESLKEGLAENEAILSLFEDEREELRKDKDVEIDHLKQLLIKSSKHFHSTIHDSMQGLTEEITKESKKWEQKSTENQAEAKKRTNIAYIYPLRY